MALRGIAGGKALCDFGNERFALVLCDIALSDKKGEHGLTQAKSDEGRFFVLFRRW